MINGSPKDGLRRAETFRCFVSLPLPDKVKSDIARFMSEARSLFPGYRFGAAENLHITLQFLGETPRDATPSLAKALSVAAEGVSAFRLDCKEAGGFPGKGKPRILHIAVTSGERELRALASRLRRSLEPLGFTDPKPFSPHITLARERNGADIRSLWEDSYIRFLENNKGAIAWEADEILIMESVLSRQGPLYTPLAGIRLKQES